jgi:hypothetical protein
MTLQLTLDSSAKHLWSSSLPYITAIQLNSITNAALYYKSTQPNSIEASKIPPYVVYPYKEYNYYLTSQGNTISAGTSTTTTTSSFQFGRVPHKIYLAVRKLRQSQDWNDSESFLPISNVNIIFGAGASGLLSSATQRQLWMMTCENLGEDASPTWEEFSGKINVSGVNGTGTATVVPSTGSILCFRPALNFQLDESCTEGSVGTFQFQAQVTFSNYTASDIAYEIMVLYEDLGIIRSSRGDTKSSLGLTDVGLVLSTKESEEPVSSEMVSQQLGGSFHKMIKMARKHFHRKHGGSDSGGSSSGGSSSGGSMRHMGKLHRLAC